MSTTTPGSRRNIPQRRDSTRIRVPDALAALLLASAFAAPVCALAQSSGADLGGLVKEGNVSLVKITPELVAANRGTVQAAVPPALLEYRPESYRISPGDTILVAIWDHPELTAQASSEQAALNNGRLVHPDGTFYFPYVGTLKVAGMRIEELRGILTSKLSRYLQSPQVDVNVVGYGSRVTLQGAFVNTSPQSVTTVPLTLSQAVGTAVVNVEQADLSGLVLTRDGSSHRIDLDAMSRNAAATPEIYLKPGDHLYMPFNDRKEVYVMGEVLRPQALTFKTSDLTLTQALGRVGGLNPATAKKEAIYVIRGIEHAENKPATVFHLDAQSPSAYALADEFQVRPGDVVYVGAAGVTRWNRFLSQLLPLSGIIRNAASVPDGGN